ncbi:MAG: hypothetical protein QT11_C0001G1018 [archaeon GW2011_AR20]|nr:MAG: hypothetical protein QT11_C0001G1018 [archaeon GW2011_AR20]AQS33425.1 hypothetical protein [uncultured archaeon]AQS33511.1 hypothetical protein [uncultured archaeon]MBS3161012.1 hypothetical protein [Candidatus Woesearchaeota archaeon]
MVAIKDQINLMIAVFLLFFVAFVDAQYMFDVDSEIINNEKVFYPGEEIIVSTDIKSLGTIKDIINVKLNYTIVDENNNLITGNESTIALHTSLKTTEYLRLPDNIESGTYQVRVKVSYQGYTTSASNTFYVKSKFFIKSSKFLYKYPLAFTAGLSLFFVIIIFLISSLIHKNR